MVNEKPKSFLETASKYAPLAGFGLDLASSLIGIPGEIEDAKEEKQRFERQHGLAVSQATWDERRKRREEQRFQAISEALKNLSRGQ